MGINVQDWVCCHKGIGYEHEAGGVSTRRRRFPDNSVGVVEKIQGELVSVRLVATDTVWNVAVEGVEAVDIFETGDEYSHKICNVCHCLLPINNFARNQNNVRGIVRRPSCKDCRTDIDKREPKSRQAKIFEKKRPKKGSIFKCPICQRRSIVGITAKIVADHNHHTGDIRDFICDSCNTGLGRFKNGKNYLYNAIHYLEERDGVQKK